MNILWVCPYAPYPPDTGGRQRVHHLLAAALEAGHRVDLFAVELDGAPYPDPLPPGLTVHHHQARIRESLRGKAAALASGLPEIAWSIRVPAVLEALAAAPPGRYDVAVVEHAHAAVYIDELARLGAPLVLDAHNVEWRVARAAMAHAPSFQRRVRFAVDAGRLRRLEGYAVGAADLVVAVSGEDAAELRRLRPGVDPVVEPNGADLEAIEWSDHTRPRGLRMLMTGHLGYIPNVDAALWAAAEVLPRVRRLLPGATLTLAGRQPSPELMPAMAAEGMELVSDPPAMSPCFAGADVFLAPLRMGSGTRIKLLEALAAGLVVVATPRALAGLEIERAGLALSGSTPEELAQAVLRAFTDAELRARVAAEGRQYVADHHDWRVIGRGFEARLRALVAARRAA